MHQTNDNMEQNTPEQNTLLARKLTLYALGLGLAAELLAWFQGPAPTGFAVWTLLLAACVCSHLYTTKTANLLHVCAWSVLACLAAAVMAFRSIPVFIPFMLLLMFTAAVLITISAIQGFPGKLKVSDVLHTGFLTLIRIAFGALKLLPELEIRNNMLSKQNAAIVRGVLLALPLLIIFLWLFASADAVVSHFTSKFTAWFSKDLAGHLIRTVIFFWLTAGLLGAMCHFKLQPKPLPANRFLLGSTETRIVMGTVSALFITFVVLQLGYLFGGRDTIEASTGLTIAAYARRGFFELVTVAAFTLILLMTMARFSADQRSFRRFAVIMIICVLIMQVSAAQRLVLYMEEFGLSMDRVNASVIMLWLAVVLLIFSSTVLRNKPDGFIYSSISSGAIILLLFAMLNPAAQITRINIVNSQAHNRELDVNYLLNLGPDAVPALLDNLDLMPAFQQCIATLNLLSVWSMPALTNPAGNNTSIRWKPYASKGPKDWRSFHYSYWRAEQVVLAQLESLHKSAKTALGDDFDAFIQNRGMTSGAPCQ